MKMPRSKARTPEKSPKREKEGARTVGRVVASLELVSEERSSLRLVDIARSLQLPSSSAHALLRELVTLECGQVVGADRRYEVGPRRALLGSRVVSNVH